MGRKSRWGNVIEDRPKNPEVRVSFNRGDEVVYETLSRWFGVTLEEFRKLIPPKKKE